MYDAKSAGRNRYITFDRSKSRHGVMSERQSWQQRLRHAIDDDLFVLHAQPIVGICTTGMPHYELLLRMLDDDGDLIFPADVHLQRRAL